MSKEQKKVNFEKEVMSKIISGKIAMRPKWYFVLGSVFSIVGLAALSIMSVFSVNIILFLLRRHGPMAQWRLEVMLESFPLWIPLLAIAGIGMGVWLLRKYDFSYKKNFPVIVIGFVISIIIVGFIIDRLGLNDLWSRGGMMRKFYQGIETRGNMQNGRSKR